MNATEFKRKLAGIAGSGTPESRRDGLLGLHRYERMKAYWRRANPKSTPAEYEAEMRRISNECGV